MTDLESIWKAYYRNLHAFVQKRVKDASVADDLLQDIFLKVYTKLDGLQSEERLASWLYQIARNVLIDHFRKQRPIGELPDSLSGLEADPVQAARQELADCLLPMIQKLPAPYQEAVMLSEIEGVAQKEVAVRQQLSLSGAKSRVQRGRGLLKTMLSECCRLEFDHRGALTDYESHSNRCIKC